MSVAMTAAQRTVLPEPMPSVDPAAGQVSRTARRLALAMAFLIVLGLAAGVAGVSSVQDRAAQVDQVITRGGPLVVAAQDLYRSLSDADATAASAFLTDGPEPVELRERYQADIANASAALATASSGITEGQAAEAVAVLSIQLPVYTGLVETARAYNRQGLPVGGAYLREASGVMRDALLPAAERLFEAVSGELDEARDGAGRFPWFALLLGVVLLVSLIVIQNRLTRRTNRVLNIGLVVASAAALAAVLWLTLSWWSASGHLDDSRRDGSAQVALLSGARIAALQARSDEAHTLVARGGGGTYEEHYQEVMTRLVGEGGLLDDATREATDERAESAGAAAMAAALQWQDIHAEVRRLDETGDYPAAVALAIGSDDQSAGSAFASLDEALGDGIGYGNERFVVSAQRADNALDGVGLGVGLLTALLLVGIVVGIQQRLGEYR
jgi:hypothetical protein